MMIYGWREREEVLRFFQKVTGLRMNHNFVRPGGVAADLPPGWRDDVLRRIGEVCAQGRQAYWVCTLVEETDEIEAQAAEETAARLRTELPQLRVGLVHGRLKAEDKEAQMRAFKEGHTQLLVATTVIEVGVDVPNASIMIIENA